MYEHLQAYLSQGIYPFHMPGHKRNPMFIPQGLADLDITEIPGMDILRTPTGILHDLQCAIADFYRADKSYLLVNGSTAGIVTAICATTAEGDKLYAARNGHVSMYSGMALSGVLPIYMHPEITAGGLAGGINPEAFDDIEEGTTTIIASPTYEGFVSDIKAIADKVHDRGGILIVDEAHGAHFSFNSAFPESALDLGADIVVQSFHKTLPALGQLAVLHVKGSRVDTTRLQFFVNAMQTTSPSYMLMGQLSYALNMLWKRPELFDMYVNRLTALRKALTANETLPIALIGQELIGKHAIHNMDCGKLLFRLNTHENAEDILATLADKYRVQPEMAAGRHLLAMTSVADTDEGMQRLWAAIGALNIRLEVKIHATPQIGYATPYPTPEQVFTPRQATQQETESIPWETAPGRIAGEVVAAYPPGIALVAPGERIPQDLPQLASHVCVLKEG